jgi:glycosyltransferase involved in cell wall biosynthesis
VACDIMYNASFYEGFGMPIIEAQSVGRPVITSDLGAMKEVAKQSAVLVDPYKSEEISAAIHRLVDDRAYYDKMVALGRENVKPYDHKAIAQQYLKVYEELA